MKLSEILEKENIEIFSSVPLSLCRVIKPYLLNGAECSAEELRAVMLVLPYPHGETGEKGAPAFAAFSRIFDYHLFFERLSEKIKDYFSDKYPGVWVKVFADHSPIDERRAAVAAGLGVIGDNALFISEKYGSFVFLGEIICSLTEMELESDGIPAASVSDKPSGCLHCGKCAAACPAGCIGEGGDKALCVSNLTQKKGELYRSEKEIIKKSGYVWGCDRCADVCPMNKNKGRPPCSEFFTAVPFTVRRYEDIEAMDHEMYQKYPFSWRKIDILKRNYDLFSKNGEKGDKNSD